MCRMIDLFTASRLRGLQLALDVSRDQMGGVDRVCHRVFAVCQVLENHAFWRIIRILRTLDADRRDRVGSELGIVDLDIVHAGTERDERRVFPLLAPQQPSVDLAAADSAQVEHRPP